MYLPLVSAILVLTMGLLPLEAMASNAVQNLKLSSLAVQYDSGTLKILDQQKLPGEEE